IWWTAVPPGVAIVLAVLGITLVGESLNDLSDPRLRTRRRVGRAPAPVTAVDPAPAPTSATAAPAGPPASTSSEGSAS
ncbi:hypothetical protein ACO1KW_14770, partial [Staphylococcus aureus]